MRESALWSTLKRGMGKKWDATRHEDAAAVGVPDVSYGLRGYNGWIELKCLDKMPKDPGAIVKINHFTPLQRHWLMTRGKAGGLCWFLLKIENVEEYLLFNWTELALVGKKPDRKRAEGTLLHLVEEENRLEPTGRDPGPRRTQAMNHHDFDQVLESRIQDLRTRLGVKSAEYSTEGDKLHNFKVAARKLDITPEQALLGMEVKHDVSITDIIAALPSLPSLPLWNEKIGDKIAYYVLLDALVQERLTGDTDYADDPLPF